MSTIEAERVPATLKLPDGRNGDSFSDLALGPLGPYELVITREDVQRWTRIHEERFPWLAGEGVEAAPPHILYYASQNLLKPIRHFESVPRENVLREGGGLARYWAEFHELVPVGTPIRIEGGIADKFIRRGLGYTVVALDAYAADTLIQRHWKAWARGVSAEEAEQWPERESDPRPPEAPAAAPTFGPIAYVASQEHINDFEGPGEVNNHTDVERARRTGLPAPRAQGGIAFGLLARLMSERFGIGFARGGSLDVRFLGTIFAGDALMARGAIVSQGADGEERCRVWIDGPDGKLRAVGLATARLR